MRFSEDYGLSIGVSLAIHLVAIFFLFLGGKIHTGGTRTEPRYMQAKFVAAPQKFVGQEQEREQAKKTPVLAPRAKKMQTTKSRLAKRQPEKQERSLAQKKQQAKIALARKKKHSKEKRHLQREMLEKQFNQALEGEHEEIQASKTVAQKAKERDAYRARYQALIRGTIRLNWSRPPSARNGMQVVLRVGFVPTGEIIEVGVLQSSGNQAFDRAAVQAVKLTRKIPQLQQLAMENPSLFEHDFRRIRITFRPEDLLR